MSPRLDACILTLALLCAPITAQVAGPGLTWAGSSSGNTGSHVPACTNLPIGAVRGESVSLGVWGDRQAPFALFVAPMAPLCLPIPGIGNALMLGPTPLVLVAAGTFSQQSPCRACPPGLQSLLFQVPLAAPLGATLSFQAIGVGGQQPAFTVAISARVV
jgi:hypothetical protein